MLYEELSGNILKAYFNVLNVLGTGYLESVYENAMCIELEELNIPYEKQKPLTVMYKDKKVGEFVADIVVDNKIILELKAVSKLVPAHSAQLINYLTITKLKVGLLLNFGEGRDYKRVYLKD
ncbi:GxxExxY protein [Prevotella sp. P6B1]|uniref:GxxExxY protein n=1 Tax=Prevotella sp. P6B1 TaxID=1410613 RepID=UPI00051CA7CE|nr:GxxExxY protein [Prevotella sp. P6B1]